MGENLENLFFSKFMFPNFELLTFGNIYSGSYLNFNYKLIPKVTETCFEVFVWAGLNCLEETKIFDKNIFELTDEGYEAAKNWIVNKFEVYSKNIN